MNAANDNDEPTKTCTKCGETKPLPEFYRHKTNKDGRQGYCKECAKANTKAWQKANPDKVRENLRRSISTPMGRINAAIRTGIYLGIQSGGKLGKKSFDAVGYTVEELVRHLEAHFLQGMSWDNYSKHGWHIDHIRPLSTFNYTTVDDPEFKQAWALTNLQPLWAKDNWSKNNTFVGPLQSVAANDNEPAKRAA